MISIAIKFPLLQMEDKSTVTNIGQVYSNGRVRVVEVDKKKAIHYYELAAMGGNVRARYNLGANEAREDNMDRAIKHWMIGTKSGHNESLKKIQDLYSNGYATKEDYTKALQSYQTYLGEIKSSHRDELLNLMRGIVTTEEGYSH